MQYTTFANRVYVAYAFVYLAYTGVYWRMLAYIGVCLRILTYDGVCSISVTCGYAIHAPSKFPPASTCALVPQGAIVPALYLIKDRAIHHLFYHFSVAFSVINYNFGLHIV